MIYGDPEIVRVDGNLFAYIKVQNEYTGNVSGSFRRIYQDRKGQWYAKCDGKNQYISIARFLNQEYEEKKYRDFYRQYASQIGANR